MQYEVAVRATCSFTQVRRWWGAPRHAAKALGNVAATGDNPRGLRVVLCASLFADLATVLHRRPALPLPRVETLNLKTLPNPRCPLCRRARLTCVRRRASSHTHARCAVSTRRQR